MEHLNGADWEDLRKKYPGAYDMMVHRSLVNELASHKLELANLGNYLDPRRKRWLESRVKDLEAGLNHGG